MKKTLSILAIALSCIAMSAAGQSYTVETVPNVQVQDARRFTSNPDGILSDGTVAEIDRMCMDLRQKKLAEVVVLVLNSVEPNSLDMFAHNVLNRWGVGWKGANNGLVISVVREQRDIQFATGYGLEGVLPDALCKRIQTVYMVTPLKDGDYNKGVLDGVRAVYNVLTGNTDELAALTAAHGERDATGKPMSFLSMIFFGALILLFLILALSRHSRGGGRGGRDRYDDYDGPSGGNSGGGGIGGSIIGGILGGMLGGGFGRGGGGFGGGGSFGGGFGGGMSGGGGSRSGF